MNAAYERGYRMKRLAVVAILLAAVVVYAIIRATSDYGRTFRETDW